MSDIVKRTFWGITLIILALGALLANAYTYAILSMFVLLVTLNEFYSLTKKANVSPSKIIGFVVDSST